MSGQFEGEGPQFEIMPFGGGQDQAQMEEERGRRGRRGGGRPPPNMSVRRKEKPPVRDRYPRPVPWPAYPVAALPLASWDQAPDARGAPDAGEPSPATAYEPFDDGAEGEVSETELKVLRRFPRELCNYLKDLPDAQRPRYKFLGMLRAVAENPGTVGMAGLYLIVFTSGGRKKAYNGMSDDLGRRLQEHVRCAAALGLRDQLNQHEVFFAKPPGNARARTIELKINRHLLKPHPGVLTNQRHEFEAELLGEAWP